LISDTDYNRKFIKLLCSRDFIFSGPYKSPRKDYIKIVVKNKS
jgi:hypothetical protein